MVSFWVAAAAMIWGAGAGFLGGWICGVAQEKTRAEKETKA